MAGDDTPIVVVGIVASVFLAAGLLPPYVELWKRHGRVVGLNWVSLHHHDRLSTSSAKQRPSMQIFLAMDWSGAFFSLMALGMSKQVSMSVGITEAYKVI
jgi:hypothetical protein